MHVLFPIWKSHWKLIGGRSSLALGRKGAKWRDCKIIMETWINPSKRSCQRQLVIMLPPLLTRSLGHQQRNWTWVIPSHFGLHSQGLFQSQNPLVVSGLWDHGRIHWGQWSLNSRDISSVGFSLLFPVASPGCWVQKENQPMSQ